MFVLSYPWLLLCLLLPIAMRLLPPKQIEGLAVRVPFGQRLAQAIGPMASSVEARPKKWLDFAAQYIVWAMLILALVRPQWLDPSVVNQIPTRDLLLLVDLSASMQQPDFTNNNGEVVDRLQAVKEVLGEFLLKREGDRVGLVVFGDAPYLQAPFSTDLSLSRRLLDECQVGMAGPRTAFGDAIGLGVNLFDSSQAPAKTIIALTDGNDTRSAVPPVEAARIARDREIRIYAVAIGDPTTVGEDKLDQQALKDVAAAADGEYFFAADRTSLQGIYSQLDKLETHQAESVSHRPRRELYFWFLGIAIVLSVFRTIWQGIRSWNRGGNHPVARSVRVDPTTGKLEVE